MLIIKVVLFLIKLCNPKNLRFQQHLVGTIHLETLIHGYALKFLQEIISNVVLHVDHIIPWSKGGETVLGNLQTLCSKCNLGKSDLL
ncbi:HNH endonuclease signature motif containing protein [Streptococcus sp. Marseille-P8640]